MKFFLPGAKGEEFPVQGHDQDRDQDQLTQDTQDQDLQNKRGEKVCTHLES